MLAMPLHPRGPDNPNCSPYLGDDHDKIIGDVNADYCSELCNNLNIVRSEHLTKHVIH